MKTYAQEFQFLREHWARELASFPHFSDSQYTLLKQHARDWADWTRTHRGVHNALTLGVFACIAGIECLALFGIPRFVSSVPLAITLGSLAHGFAIYSLVIYGVHECGAHQLGFLGDGPAARGLQQLAANASRLQLADPGFYREQHKTHHRYLGTERDETNSHFIWPTRFLVSLLPGAGVLPFNDYKVDPGTPCPGRRTTNLVGFGYLLTSFAATGLVSGWIYAVAVLLFIGPWIGFSLDRLRETTEHQLMPVDRLQGARNHGLGFWGILVGGGPWGQTCHLSHHLFPDLPWYAQIAMDRQMRQVFTPEQRRAFLGEGRSFPRLLVQILSKGFAFQRQVSAQASDTDRLTAAVTESMLVGEHPDEPLGIWIHFDLHPDTPSFWFEPERLRTLIAQIIEAEPQLRTVWSLSDTGQLMRAASAASVAELVEKVLSRQSLSADEFLHAPTGNQDGPNFFLRIQPGGASLKCHHSVMDGRAVMDFLQKFLVHLHSGEPWVPVGLPQTSLTRWKWALSLPLGLWLGLRRLVRNSRNPAHLFTGRRQYTGTRIHYRSKSIGLPWLESLLARARARLKRISSTELILAGYHRALADLEYRRSKSPASRIAVMMTIDGYAGDRQHRPFSNYSLGESISIDLAEAKDARKLIAAIQSQSTRGWTPLFPGASSIRWVRSLLQLQSLLRIPYFRRAAVHKAQTGMPLRTSTDSDAFGKQADTALYSALGRTPLPNSLRPFVTQMYGHAPFLNPMGVSFTYALDATATFNLAASDTCLTGSETEALLNDLHRQMEQLIAELEAT